MKLSQNTTHQCPGPQCQAKVPRSQLACGSHWYQVPHDLRTEVYRTWNRGKGAGTAEHQRAMDAAVKAMLPIGAGR